MILRIILILAAAFILAAIATAPRRKRVRRQYGVPYANNIHRLADRARRKARA